MDTHLDLSLAASYTSHSQIARVVTEGWVAENMYCPRCGCSHLTHLNRGCVDRSTARGGFHREGILAIRLLNPSTVFPIPIESNRASLLLA